ncbi:MAG: DUF389 domain-containing protein [Cytophagaceae bacterium]|nr:MAG: DUF389 domain-containing protein [Cytophagaceae bacterium]
MPAPSCWPAPSPPPGTWPARCLAAGAIGFTRRERGNVVPGVAIATALTPLLRTAGYRLATAHWAYFGRAVVVFYQLRVCQRGYVSG